MRILIICLPLLFVFTGRGQTFDSLYNTGYSTFFASNIKNTADSGCVMLTYTMDSSFSKQSLGILSLYNSGLTNKKSKIDIMGAHVYANPRSWNQWLEISESTSLLALQVSGLTGGSAIFSKIQAATWDTTANYIIPAGNDVFAFDNIIRIAPNKFYAIGIRLSPSFTSDVVILPLDSSLVLQQLITVSSMQDCSVVSAILVPHTRDILLAARCSTNNRLVLVDTNGIIKKDITSLTWDSTYFVTFKYSAADSCFVGFGSRRTSMYTKLDARTKPMIAKYDLNLNLKWLKFYGEDNPANSCWNGMVEPKGEIVVAGLYSERRDTPYVRCNYKGLLMKVSATGQPKWVRLFDKTTSTLNGDLLHSVCKNLEGGYYACGAADFPNKPTSRAWVLKLDSSGCLQPGCVSEYFSVDSVIVPAPVDVGSSQLSNYNFKVFPNPAKETVTISGAPELGDLREELYDVSGRLVQSSQVMLPATVSLSSLKPGVYLLRISQGERVIYSSRLLKTE